MGCNLRTQHVLLRQLLALSQSGTVGL